MSMFAGDRKENFQFIIFLPQFVQSTMNVTHFVGETDDFVLLFEIRIGLLQQFVLQLLDVRVGTCYEESEQFLGRKDEGCLPSA